MLRLVVVLSTLAVLCISCSSNQPVSAPHRTAPYYVQVSHYATRIADVAKTIRDCVSAEAHASASHIDLSFMTDKEKDICGGDDQSIDRFLPLDAPSGFERTGSVVASLRTDLENHDPPASDYDMHIEAADIDAVIRTFDS